MLKLDDLITEEPTFSLKGKTFHFDFSLKAMVMFQKWSQIQNLDEVSLELRMMDLLRIIVQDFDDFWNHLQKLSFNNQTKIVNQLIKTWVDEMTSGQSGKEVKKK